MRPIKRCTYDTHCVKSARIRCYSGPYFRTEYREIRNIQSDAGKMQTRQYNSEYEHFSRSENYH